MRDTSFARPVRDLVGNEIAVTSAPSPGQGYALDQRGTVPLTMNQGSFTVEIVTVSVNITSTLQFVGGNMNVTIPGLRVNDLVFVMGAEASDARQFILRARCTCTTAETIVLDYFNADDGTVDPAAVSVCFFVLHRGMEAQV